MKQLGKYEIVDLIGSGAYAEVYKAVDTVLRRTVALKLLKPSLLSDDEAVPRFLQEAQTAANLIHPHIAWVWDLGELDGRYYLAMRYIDGESLDKVLKTKGQLSWDEAIKYISQISDALTFAHAGGLVHRDIKPQNIMISPKDGAVLTDFGLVRAMEAGSIGTRTGALMGTPAYMAPEIWQGEPAGPAADQYSLACVLVEMLTGKPLFGGPTPPAVMRQHLLEGPRLPEVWPVGCPTGLTNVVRQALAQNPAERHSGIPAFVAALMQPEPPADARSDVRISDEQPVLEAEKPAADLPQILADLSPDVPVPSDPLPAAALKAAPSQPVTPPPPDLPRSSDQDKPNLGYPPRKTSPISRPRLPVWAIALIILGGLGFLAICGLGTAWMMDWLPGSSPTAVVVANPTKTPLPPVTATTKPTTRPITACTEIGQTWTSPVDGMTLFCVPAGDFLMGSTDGDGYPDADEKPQHTVYMDAYWIDQTEVTNAQYARCVAAGDCQAPGSVESNHRDNYYGNSAYANYPVIYVSWDDAVDYCAWAGRELPSEAEWEKAARGTDGRIYPWGNQAPNSGLLNFDMNIGDTTAVGSYPDGASPYGALDMAGNVWEWTQDWYDENYYSSQTTWRNPAGPSSTAGRVVRGGSWHDGSGRVRAAYRYWRDPDFRNYYQGFRCRLSP